MEGKKKIYLALGAALVLLTVLGVLTVNRDQLMGNVSQLSDTTTIDVSLEGVHLDVFGFDVDTSNPNQLVKEVESYEGKVSDNLVEAESHYVDGQDAVANLDLEKYILAVDGLAETLSDTKESVSQSEAILHALTRKLSSLTAEKESLESVSTSTSDDYDALLEDQQELIDELEDAKSIMEEAQVAYEFAKTNTIAAENLYLIAAENYSDCLDVVTDVSSCGADYQRRADASISLMYARDAESKAQDSYEEAVEYYDSIKEQLDGITAFLIFYHQGSAETDEEISSLTTRIGFLTIVINKIETSHKEIEVDLDIIQNYFSSLLAMEEAFDVLEDDEADEEEEEEEEKEEEEEPTDESYDLSIYNLEYASDSDELEVEICATNLSSSMGVILMVSIEGSESANLLTLDQSGCPEATVSIDLEHYELSDSNAFEVSVTLNESKLSEESDQANNFESDTFVYESLVLQDDEPEEEEEEEEQEDEDENDPRYGHPFYDVNGHWGEPYIDEAYSFGWVQGTGGGRFEPNRYVNTAEFIKLMAETKGHDSYTIYESEFTIDTPSWLERYLIALEATDVIRVRDGLISNFADDISRCDASLYLARLYDVEYYLDGSLTGFNDLDSNMYCAYAVVGLSELGVINGYPDGSFRPENTLTRAEALSLLMNAKELL